MENFLYETKFIDTNVCEIKFVEYNKEENLTSVKDEKELETELIEIKEGDLPGSITDFLNKKFVQMAREEGYKNRDFKEIPRDEDGEIRFDIDVEKIREDLKKHPPIDNNFENPILRRVISRLNMAGSWIAVTGRIGPGNFIICNESTYDYLKKIFDSVSYTYFKMFADNSLDDDEIIVGRKNSLENPGIISVIDKNSLQNIVYNEDGNRCVDLSYGLYAIGFYPEKQYLTLKIKK